MQQGKIMNKIWNNWIIGKFSFGLQRSDKSQKISILFVFLLFMILSQSCIKYFDPKFDDLDINKMVVNGLVSNIESYSYVKINTTSPLNKPALNPVENCQVYIENKTGSKYFYTEFEPGNYRCYMLQANIVEGTSFRLVIETPSGEIIQSEYDSIMPAVTVDSIYYTTNSIGDGLHPIQGIQFYINLKALNSKSEFFKWDIEETWEKHAPMPIIWWYDGQIHKEDPPDYSKNLCYQTEMISNIYTLTTRNLKDKIYFGYPLHFVDTRSQRLSYLYSILVRQFSISQSSYDYWEKLKNNMELTDGLYTGQPISVVGNLKNITHPEKNVLGIFSAVGATEKRIFVKDPPGIIADFEPCQSGALRFGLRDISLYDYPAYLDGNETRYFNVQLSPGCVDCTRNGGTTVKPDFWP